jgi:hypothetical protein
LPATTTSQHAGHRSTAGRIWWRFSEKKDPDQEKVKEQGAGWGDPEDNAAVEQAAVAHVQARYEAGGWQVASVEAERIGYDLRCRREDEERHVEVKGVGGTLPAFLLTEGERRRAETDPLWWVAVVTEALGPEPRCLEVTGKALLEHWNLDPVTWHVSPRPAGNVKWMESAERAIRRRPGRSVE